MSPEVATASPLPALDAYRAGSSLLAVNSVTAAKLDSQRAQAGEPVQELLQRLALTLFPWRKAVKGIKWPRFAVLQNDARSRHPVGALPGDQVTNDVERALGIFSFVAAHPDVRQSAQQRIQGYGSAENCDGLGQVKFRHACHANADASLALWIRARGLRSHPAQPRSLEWCPQP